MKKRVLTSSIFLAVSIFFCHGAFAAWTQPKGHSYNQVTLSYYKTTKKFSTIERDPDTKDITDVHAEISRNEEEEFSSTKVTYYGEYGITDKLTVIASVLYDWQKSNDTMRYANEDGPSGIGDITLGLRHSLVDNIAGTGILMSVQGDLKIPEAYDYGDPATELSLGDGQYDATVALLFGRGLGKGYAWLNAGYKFRFENDENDPITFKPSDQIKVSFGGGYAVTSWLSIRGLIDWTKSVGDADVSDAMIRSFYPTGVKAAHARDEIILDSMGLEPDSLSAGIDLAFNITPSIQTVFSYNRGLSGFGDIRTRNFSLGETFSVAFVYMH